MLSLSSNSTGGPSSPRLTSSFAGPSLVSVDSSRRASHHSVDVTTTAVTTTATATTTTSDSNAASAAAEADEASSSSDSCSDWDEWSDIDRPVSALCALHICFSDHLT